MKHKKAFNIALASAVASAGVVAVVPTQSEAAITFKDVDSTNSHAWAISELAERGVIKGYSDGTFRWAAALTRGQAAKIIANVLELDTENVADPGFSDVKKTDEYYGAIAALKAEGIISGRPDGTYGQHDAITRGQMAKVIVEAFDLTGYLETPFKDLKGAESFINYIGILYANGVTTGTTAHTYSPLAPIKRGQFASLVVRAEKVVGKPNPGEGENPDTGVDPDVGINPDPGDTPTPPTEPGGGDTPTPPTPPTDPGEGGTPSPQPAPIKEALDAAIENLIEAFGDEAASVATLELEDDNTVRVSFISDDLELVEIRHILREVQEGMNFFDLIEEIPAPSAALLFDSLETITVRAGDHSQEFQRADYFDDTTFDINRNAVIENTDRFIDEAHRENGLVRTVGELREKYNNGITITVAGVTYTVEFE
ncbi:MAG: S-layer homology domain-containing protein [Lysinibacillus sp.]